LASIIQRPFGIVADPAVHQKPFIFRLSIRTHWLLTTVFCLKDKISIFRWVLMFEKFTSGVVHINTHSTSEISTVFSQAKGAEVNKFSGPHPVGCVGVQIHHIDPINKGDVVWTINPFAVIQIGKLFLNGYMILRESLQ
jgi:Na+-transporting NADH:ubiquinone oxidoreductase subunit A